MNLSINFLKNVIKFLMRIIYQNEYSAKYGIKGGNYIKSLLAATYFIIITEMLIFSVLICFWPVLLRFIKQNLHFLNSTFGSFVIGAGIFIFLKIEYKEEDVMKSNFSKKFIEKWVQIFIVYGVTVPLLAAIIAWKFWTE